MFEQLRAKGFEILTLHHAEAILTHDMGDATAELETALVDVAIPAEEIVRGGGGEGGVTQRLRHALSDDHQWRKHVFEMKRIVDGEETESISHEIDHVKKFVGGTIALEIEWNNKDPFFDRDLENFKRLHADGVVSVGVVVTRGHSLQSSLRSLVEEFARQRGIESLDDVGAYYVPTPRQRAAIQRAVASRGSFAKGWAHAFVSDKFGEATTHWRKLEARVHRGVGNPCPLLLVGIPSSVVVV